MEWYNYMTFPSKWFTININDTTIWPWWPFSQEILRCLSPSNGASFSQLTRTTLAWNCGDNWNNFIVPDSFHAAHGTGTAGKQANVFWNGKALWKWCRMMHLVWPAAVTRQGQPSRVMADRPDRLCRFRHLSRHRPLGGNFPPILLLSGSVDMSC